jgi:DNA-binding transcriptional MerR regulator
MEKLYYTISEVCKMLGIKHYTIRYWETEFPTLKSRTKKGYSRRYSQKDIEFLKMIRDLVYERKFTLEGAKAEIRRIKQNEISEEEIVGNQARVRPESIKAIKEKLLAIKKVLTD